MFRYRTWLLALTFFSSLSSPALAGIQSTLPVTVSAFLKTVSVPESALSATILPVGNRTSPLLTWQSDVPRNPASVAKLLTTIAALDTLGGDFTWFTDFYYTGYIAGDTLHGNLHIRGGGDPKFVIERIQETMNTLRARGIKTVKGNMVLDNSAFDLPRLPVGEFDGEVLRPYNVQPDALMVNFKSVILTFTPDRKRGVAHVAVEPPMAGLRVPSKVPLRRGRCGDWRTGLRGTFMQAARYQFRGTYPSACGERSWPIAYIAPDQYASKALLGIWQSLGGKVSGKVISGPVPSHAQLLYRAPSLPLRTIIADVNKMSNNMMAQQVFLTLAMTPNQPATIEKARARILAWWERALGSEMAKPVIDNGSGLSRDGRISADALIALLQHAAQNQDFTDFYESLGIAGIDGTVLNMGRDGTTPLSIGNAHLKTGSLKDVTALAGYVTGVSGQRYAIAAMINHDDAPKARGALYRLVEWAAQH